MPPLIKVEHDGQIDIAVGLSRLQPVWSNQRILWSAFLGLISETTRTRETLADYMKMHKGKQDEIKDVGGYIGGYLRDGKRKSGSLEHRSLLTLDADFARLDLLDTFYMLYGSAAAVYSTHKHTPEKPRLRLIVPLSRTVTGDEYQAVSRKLASVLGMEQFDGTIFQPTRITCMARPPIIVPVEEFSKNLVN